MDSLAIYSNSSVFEKAHDSEFNIKVNLSSGSFKYGQEDIKFTNLLNLTSALEKSFSFDNVIVYGSVLSYSSEINVRTIFAGLLGITKKSLRYIDADENITSRVGLLSRVFNAIGVRPEFSKLNGFAMLEFRRDVSNAWEDFERALVCKVVSQNMLSTQEFIEGVSKSIEKKKPYSFIRVNHCENRLLGYGVSYSQEEAEITYQIQFGYNLEKNDTSAISHMLRGAVADADSIGLPTLKKLSSNKLHILENSTYFHLRYFNCYLKKSYTSVNIHYELGRALEFKRLLCQVNKIYAITCRNLAKLESSLGREVEVIKIPAEYVYSENSSNQKHYPDIFFQVLNRISKSIKPGDLVLVGAGILGKIYCNEVKKAGGVAIDLGSLFDAISGINTRGNGFNDDFWWNVTD
ncbi:hypothetical protein [Comamonas sp. lk]|uniref:GT-D fold domain-containing protein n=1 Tax=Comamonas sp. lk TaxID=2201272 RepID=UPI0013CEF291|nr:hypothetical protein [Comamonas sp. lk]